MHPSILLSDNGTFYKALGPTLGKIVVVKQKEIPNVNLSMYKTARVMAPTSGILVYITASIDLWILYTSISYIFV